jgi:hypothetical protein
VSDRYYQIESLSQLKGWIAGYSFDRDKHKELKLDFESLKLLVEGVAVNSTAEVNIVPGLKHVGILLCS